MRIWLGIFFVFFALPLFSQNSWLLGDSTRFDNSWGIFNLKGNGSYRSNVFNNQLIDHLVIGGGLDPENLENLESGLNKMNRIGGDVSVLGQFYSLSDTLLGLDNTGLLVQAGSSTNAWSYFSRDDFRLGFLGNEMFRGRSADLDGNEFNTITYQKVGIGLFNKKTHSSVAVNLVNGQQFTQIDIDQADLFT